MKPVKANETVTNRGHAELVEAAALGAAAGAATGIAGGPPGIVAGGIVGALVGSIAGSVMERAKAAESAHDRELDEVIGVTGRDLGGREAAVAGLDDANAREAKPEARRLRAELLAEHAELELLIGELHKAIQEGDGKALVEPWRTFEQGLAAHFAVEETDLLPVYRLHAPDEARAFERAHAEIRELVDDLGIRIELHAVRAEELDRLLEILRKHRCAEEAAFYRWVDRRDAPEAHRR